MNQMTLHDLFTGWVRRNSLTSFVVLVIDVMKRDAKNGGRLNRSSIRR